MQLGFGCVNLGSASGGLTGRSPVRLVQEAVDRGVLVFDTADVYGSGGSERVLGRALRNRRADVFIATKAGYTFRSRSTVGRLARRAGRPLAGIKRSSSASSTPVGGAYATQDFSPAYLRRAVEDSLRRLQSDHVDLLQLHGPHQLIPDLFDQLHDLRATGKVGAFGIGAESLADAEAWLGTAGVEFMQLPFGVLDPGAEANVLPEARRRSIETWARGVFAGGVLAAASRDPTAVRGHPKFQVIEDLRRTADRAGLDVFQLALGFVRSCPDVSLVLLGMSSREHLHRNLRLMETSDLSAETLAETRTVLARHAPVLGGA